MQCNRFRGNGKEEGEVDRKREGGKRGSGNAWVGKGWWVGGGGW